MQRRRRAAARSGKLAWPGSGVNPRPARLASVSANSGTTIPLPKRGYELECTTTTTVPLASAADTIDVPLGSPNSRRCRAIAAMTARWTAATESSPAARSRRSRPAVRDHASEPASPTTGGRSQRLSHTPSSRRSASSKSSAVSAPPCAATLAGDRVADRSVEQRRAAPDPLAQHVGETGQAHDRARRDRLATRVVDAAVGVHLRNQIGSHPREPRTDLRPREALDGECDRGRGKALPREVGRDRRARRSPRPPRAGRPRRARRRASDRRGRRRHGRRRHRRPRSAPPARPRTRGSRSRSGHPRSRTSAAAARSPPTPPRPPRRRVATVTQCRGTGLGGLRRGGGDHAVHAVAPSPVPPSPPARAPSTRWSTDRLAAAVRARGDAAGEREVRVRARPRLADLGRARARSWPAPDDRSGCRRHRCRSSSTARSPPPSSRQVRAGRANRRAGIRSPRSPARSATTDRPRPRHARRRRRRGCRTRSGRRRSDVARNGYRRPPPRLPSRPPTPFDLDRGSGIECSGTGLCGVSCIGGPPRDVSSATTLAQRPTFRIQCTKRCGRRPPWTYRGDTI